MTILTGTRCTTLTKLPVAFSTGKADEFRAGAQLNAVDMAAQIKRRDRRRRWIFTGWPGRIWASWLSLKFAVIQGSGTTMLNIVVPGWR